MGNADCDVISGPEEAEERGLSLRLPAVRPRVLAGESSALLELRSAIEGDSAPG